MSAVPVIRHRIAQASEHTPNGTVLGIAFACAANLMCLVGMGALVAPAFVGGALAITYGLSRTVPLMAAEFSLWLWLLGPQVRRVTDQATGYHDPSIVLLAAPLASLVMLPRIRELRWLRLQHHTRPLLALAAALVVGYAVGAARLGLRPATAALLMWIVPVLFGLQLVAVTRDVETLRAMTDRVLVWGALVIGVYGIAQYFLVPPWDAFWMEQSGMRSIGLPEPFEVRVFSTLNSPGPLAAFLTAALLYITGTDHSLRMPALLVGFPALGLSAVRSSWIACVLGLALILMLGRARAKVTALVALALVVVGVLQFSGPIQATISDRIDQSRAGTADNSFQGRLARYETVVPLLADDALGRGLGAAGGVSSITSGGPADIANLDSGLLAFSYALGLPLAFVGLGSIGRGAMELARIGLRGRLLSAGLVAGAMSILVQMVGGNTLTGVTGITFFLLWSLALHQLVEVRTTTTIVSRNVTQERNDNG